MSRSDYYKVYREARIEAGLCVDCGVLSSTQKCDNCRTKRVAQERARLRSAQSEGLCGTCGSRAPDGNKKTCSYCLKAIKNRHQKLRATVLHHYGGRCQYCGESNPAYLSIDHVHNDGAQHRKQVPSSSLYRWLRKQGYPEGFQVLCFNCNWSKGHGYNPHEDPEMLLAASGVL